MESPTEREEEEEEEAPSCHVQAGIGIPPFPLLHETHLQASLVHPGLAALNIKATTRRRCSNKVSGGGGRGSGKLDRFPSPTLLDALVVQALEKIGGLRPETLAWGQGPGFTKPW